MMYKQSLQVSSDEEAKEEAKLPSDGLSDKTVPPDINWAHVSFHVGHKIILSECWGEVKAKQLCAVMGPSGAGKSSLLNVLAGRSHSAPGIDVAGKVANGLVLLALESQENLRDWVGVVVQIKVGGKDVNPVEFRKNIAYLMQDDALLTTATPREALTFSATMRLPDTVSRDDIENLVDNLLENLGLKKCADSLIGGGMVKGISGGERKRTSVGLELVADPLLLFLDEPTSGLDSTSAINLVRLLRQTARRHCTILCTIHQPSSAIFYLLDTVIFMKAGRILYLGPPGESVSYFSHFGHDCPKNYNPSDFIMFLCNTIKESESEELFMRHPMHLIDAPAVISSDKVFRPPEVRHSFLRQMQALVAREASRTLRDKTALQMRFGVAVFLNFLFGLVFFQAGGRSSTKEGNFSDHFGAVSMALTACMSSAAQPILISFPSERPVFLREYTCGTYTVLPYSLAKWMVEMPVTLLQCAIIWTILYFMMDLQGDYFLLLLTAWGLSETITSLAILIGCVRTSVKEAMEMFPLIFVPQMLFSGFFIRVSQIPVYLRWAQYACALKYAMNLLILNEFNPDRGSCDATATSRTMCENLLDSNDAAEGVFYVYILILLAMFTGFRATGMAALATNAKAF